MSQSQTNGLSGLTVQHAAVHEYIAINKNLAMVTASFYGPKHDAAALERSLASVLKNQAHAVRGSFRWLNETSAVGYVYSAAPVEAIDGQPDEQRFHKVDANVYMDREDQSVWEMSEGSSGRFLARKNVDDLTEVLDSVRSGTNHLTPRLRNVDRSKASVNELASFVMAGSQNAEVDHGIVIEATDDHFIVKSFALDGEAVTVPQSQLVSTSTLDPQHIPNVKREHAQRLLASRQQRDTASADPMNPKLTPAEFWTLVYSYDKPFLAKVLEQVRRYEAL